MDPFVQHQLAQLGRQDLIPVFRDNGYNQESYRQLTLVKLVQLLSAPDNADLELVTKIMRNVESLNISTNPFLFPPPSVVVKTEPVEEVPGADNGDDEVEIVQVKIRAPSGFNVMEIKEERPEVIKESVTGISIAKNGSGPLAGTPSASTTSTGTVQNQASRNAGTPGTSSDNSRASSSNPSCNALSNLPGTSVGKGRLGSWSRILKVIKPLNHFWDFETEQEFGSNEDEQSRKKIRRIDISSSYEFEVKFSTVDQLDIILVFMEQFGGKLSKVVKRLELNDTSDEARLISNVHVQRLANLPPNLWSQLTTLVFNLSFPEHTDFNIITTILSKCTSLKNLKICRGTFPSSDEVKSLQIPAMDTLVSFKFAGCQTIFAASFVTVADPVDVEADTYRNRQIHPKFRIDFGTRAYPMLETISVGSLIDLNFECLSQFPEIKCLDLGYSQESLLSKQRKDLVFRKLFWTRVGSGINCNTIKAFPYWYPNLTELDLYLPSTNIICLVIRVMANMYIKRLDLMVSFDFESALVTALCGLSYTMVTENDKTRMEKLKQYKHWKAFASEFKIEIPRKEFDPLVPDNAESIEDLDSAEIPTIGSFKHLKCVKIRRLPRTIHMPEGNLHWRNPKVKISTDEWSSVEQIFPSCILLEELTKLKGTLEAVNLVYYEVAPEVAAQFQRIMGFKIRFDMNKTTKKFDTLYLADLETSVGKRVKEEEQQ